MAAKKYIYRRGIKHSNLCKEYNITSEYIAWYGYMAEP